MAAESRGRRELLALIHQHLMRAGFARAARELQAQLGQKLLPSLATSLEEIFTHWEKTPSKARRRKLSDEEAAIPEKIRVPDPVSSSESSEKEEDEKEKTKTGNATTISPVTNSAANVESSEDDDSSSEEEMPSGKGAVTVTPAVVSGKAANSLHSPIKPSAPGSKVAVPSAANRTVLSNKQQPSAPVVTPAKAGQRLPGPGKPGRAVAAMSQAGQSKAPVITKAPESSSSSSSSSESEEEKETPTVKAPAPKVELKQAAGEAESSSEESSDETSSEEELATTAVQAKPAVKAVQVNSTPVKTAPATSVSSKKSTVKQRAATLNQTKHGSVTVSMAAKPDDTSESSDSSDSGNEEPPSVTQSKPSLKTSQAIPSPVKTTPAASLSSKATPAKTPSLSQGKPASKPAVLKQAKATPGGTAAPAKPADSTNPAESTASSSSEEEDLPVPVSQKRLPEQPGPVPSLSQAAKATAPEKAGGSTLKNETSESGSSDSSDSEEETPGSQTQPALPAVKSNAVPQPTSVKKVPVPTPTPAPSLPMDSSDDSSEESDSDEEIVPPTQTLSQQNIKPTKVSSTVAAKANATPPSGKGIKAPPIPLISRMSESSNSDSSESNAVVGEAVPPPCLKQTAPVGKAPPASPAAPQAASILRSPTAKSKKPGLQPAQDARLSQAASLTQAEESSDSSSSSDSDEETPKQPPKPAGMLQKPGRTEPDDSSSSDSSEDEEAASQSLLTGYASLSKSPATPQTPKMVPPQPVGNAGQGKAAVNATSSLAKVSVKAAPADSSSSDSSDSDTDVERVSANHKAESKPLPGQEATGASNREKGAGKTDASHANPKPSPVKKALAAKENDVEAKETQANPLPSALLSTPQPEESSLGSKSEVATAAGVPAVQTPEGLEEKKKKKKEKKEKKEKKKPSSTADKAVKTSKGKDKENKKQKASQKRKQPGEDGAVGQPKEKKWKGQTNEEVPKKKKKKAAGDLEKLPGSKEKKKSSKKKKTGKEKKNKKMPTEGESTADGSAEVHKKKKKKKKTAEPEGLL